MLHSKCSKLVPIPVLSLQNVAQLLMYTITAHFSSLTDAGFDRYKLVVQVVIGEQRGQGIK